MHTRFCKETEFLAKFQILTCVNFFGISPNMCCDSALHAKIKLDRGVMHKILHTIWHNWAQLRRARKPRVAAGRRERENANSAIEARPKIERLRLEKAWKTFWRQFRLIWPTFAASYSLPVLYFTLFPFNLDFLNKFYISKLIYIYTNSLPSSTWVAFVKTQYVFTLIWC